jgi:hypothetical protein
MWRRNDLSINMPILRGRSLITKQNLAMSGGRRFVRLARPADLPVDPGATAFVVPAAGGPVVGYRGDDVGNIGLRVDAAERRCRCDQGARS